MKFVRETSPYIRKDVSVKRMMIDVLIALVPVLVFSVVQNGLKALSVIAISILTMLIVEIVVTMIIKWPEGMKRKELFSKAGIKRVYSVYTINNITAPLISSIIYAMIMPSGCDLYVVFIGAFVGMLFGKMVFGGLGNNPFNPAAVGRIMVGVCFGSKLDYSLGGVDVAAGGTPLAQINGQLGSLQEALSNYSLLDLFLGRVPGCMGEVSALMIIIGAVYLFVRKSADIRSCLSMLVSFTVLMLVAGLASGNNVIEFTLYQLLSGGILFGAVFMVTDPVTSPITKTGRIAFGTLVGILTALIRLFGAYPEGVAFSILIANMFVSVIDYYKWSTTKYNYKQAIAWVAVMAVMCLIVGFGVRG